MNVGNDLISNSVILEGEEEDEEEKTKKKRK